MAKTCKFSTLEDDLLRDRIICGIRENGVRKRLLQESDLTVKRCVDMCRAAETTMEQTKIMTSKDEIHKVKVGGRPSGSQGKNPPKSMSSNAITAVDYTKNRNKTAQHTAKHALTAGKRIIS